MVLYIAGAFTSCEAIWVGTPMDLMKIEVQKPFKLLIDNKSAICLAKYLVLHGRSKHIETGYHFLRDQVQKGVIEVCHCFTQQQLADIFTQSLKTDQFIKIRTDMSVTLFDTMN